MLAHGSVVSSTSQCGACCFVVRRLELSAAAELSRLLSLCSIDPRRLERDAGPASVVFN